MEAVGEAIVRAGLAGCVRWASQEARTLSPSVPFKLDLPEFPDSMVVLALKCARLASKGAKQGPNWGVFTADAISGLAVTAPLLRYQVPAEGLGTTPLLAALSAGVVPVAGAAVDGPALALLALKYNVSQELGRAFRGGCGEAGFRGAEYLAFHRHV